MNYRWSSDLPPNRPSGQGERSSSVGGGRSSSVGGYARENHYGPVGRQRSNTDGFFGPMPHQQGGFMNYESESSRSNSSKRGAPPPYWQSGVQSSQDVPKYPPISHMPGIPHQGPPGSFYLGIGQPPPKEELPPLPPHAHQEAKAANGADASTRKSTIDLDEEVNLFEDHKSRDSYNGKSDLFSVIKATEHLEIAWNRGIISSEAYEKECWMLLNQFKNIHATIKDDVPDILRFMEEYNLIAPAASRRLIEVKIPATVENGEGKAETNEHEFLRVAQTVHNFISAADNIRLNFVAVDQVQPNLLEILCQLDKIQFVPPDFEGKLKIKGWLTKSQSMKASDKFNEEEVSTFKKD